MRRQRRKTHDKGSEPGDPSRRLLQAAAGGDRQELERALDAGANINTRDESGLTPLMHSVRRGDSLSEVRFLVERGADVNARDRAGRTVLDQLTWPAEPPEDWENEHEAWAHSEQNYIYDYLKRLGAELTPAEQPVPPAPAETWSAEPVALAPRAPTASAAPAEEGRLAHGMDWMLFAAIQHGSPADVESILATDKVSINARDEGGWTPLMRAVASGNIEIVRALLDNGADPAVRDKRGVTALSVAGPAAQAILKKYLRPK